MLTLKYFFVIIDNESDHSTYTKSNINRRKWFPERRIQDWGMWLTGHRKGLRGKEEIQSKVKHDVGYIREAEERTLTGITQRLHLLPEVYFYYWTNNTYVQKDQFYRTNHNVCLQKNPVSCTHLHTIWFTSYIILFQSVYI